MSEGWEEIAAAMQQCVARSLAQVMEDLPGLAIAGCAILTDDDLSTAYVAFCSRERADEEGPDLLFVPTDWEIEGPDACGPSIGERLRELERRSSLSFADFVDRAFASLVEGARRVREGGLLEEGAYLMVGSTDPGAHLERLEEEATVALNSPATVASWRTWREACEEP